MATLPLSTITEFFGWATLIHFGFLSLMTLLIILFNKLILSIHQRLLNLSEPDLHKLYANYLSAYKLMSIIFFAVPWVTLKLMGY